MLWLFVALFGGCTSEPEGSDRERIAAALALPSSGNTAPMRARVTQQETRRDAVVERVEFDGRSGQRIPALVAYSEIGLVRPLPVVLCMPGSPNRKEDLVAPRDLLLGLAQAGFFVLSIDRPYHGDRPGDKNAAMLDKGLPRVLGEYVDDLRRALDYAATRPQADMRRVGMLGLSMGGVESLLLAAVDDRVGCVVSVSGQLSWQDIFRSDSWSLIFTGLPLTSRLLMEGADGDAVQDAFLQWMPELTILDAPRIAATLAPRPLLLMTGLDDPFVTPEGTQRTYDAALAAYRDVPDQLQMWVDPAVGHAFSNGMQQRARDWFQRWLLAP